MREAIWKRLTLLVSVTILGCILVECGARLFVAASEASYGRLFRAELPQLKVFPETKAMGSVSAKAAARLYYGGPLTYGDVSGVFREDPVLGYTVQENAISKHGWWQSNALGARARRPIPRDTSARRLLVFGESFAHGSRVRQEDSWPAILDSLCPDLEVVNFGVDGYSMGQAYLRYLSISSALKHDAVLFMFVPTIDLWREVNVLRSLRGWAGIPLLPRFVIDERGLKLVESPYPSLAAAVEENRLAISQRLHDHLRQYDRLYCAGLYKLPPLLGESVLYKIAAVGWCKARMMRRKANLLEPEGEAARVTRAIFNAVRFKALGSGRRFIIALLPARQALEKLEEDEGFARELGTIGRMLCSEHECVDLGEDLAALSREEIDVGLDGTHYGPAVNSLIAESLASQFKCWSP